MSTVIDFATRPAREAADRCSTLALDGEVLPPMGEAVDFAKRRARLAKRYGSDFEEGVREVVRQALMEVLPGILREVLGEMIREAVNAEPPRKRTKRLAAPQARSA